MLKTMKGDVELVSFQSFQFISLTLLITCALSDFTTLHTLCFPLKSVFSSLFSGGVFFQFILL